MLFIAVYGSPNSTSRNQLWKDITIVRRKITSPWIITCDFNCIMNVEKKIEGRVATQTKRKKFRDWVNECQLMAIG